MADIILNISKLREQIPSTIKIVAVSKTKTVNDIMEAYKSGQRIFGENRVQELLAKKDFLPADISWHLIGHLQSNKVKYIVPFVSMIQSVDSFKLLTIINNEAERISRKIDCLLQFHIAKEETKFGFGLNEAAGMIASAGFKSLININICGVMGMATYTENMNIVREEFRYLRNCYSVIKENYFSGSESFKEISMGMSGDFPVAIEEGCTMIRIGSLIFGERN
jgi:PLP dependent protein